MERLKIEPGQYGAFSGKACRLCAFSVQSLEYCNWHIGTVAPKKRKGGTLPPKMRLTDPDLVCRAIPRHFPAIPLFFPLNVLIFPDTSISLIIVFVPVVFFCIVCLTATQEKQLLVAQVIGALFAMLMTAVVVGTSLQIQKDGILSPHSIFLFAVIARYSNP